jgi:hypothetical protein
MRTFLLALAFEAAAMARSYTVSVIPPPSGFTLVSMSGINNAGQVAGYYESATTLQAFIGATSGSTTIPFPAGFNSSSGWAINNLGQVTGSLYNTVTGAEGAFIGTPSGSTVIPPPSGGGIVSSYAINDLGQITGEAVDPGSVAYIGTVSGSTAIPPPSGFFPYVYGEAINSSGQVAEVAGLAGPTPHMLGTYSTYIGTTSGSTAIPPIDDLGNMAGYAINDSGQVAGTVGSVRLGYPGRAFIGTISGAMLIPLPVGAGQSEAYWGCLNNLGMVVGVSDAGGWVWSASSGTQLLNTMVPSGWIISNAVSISNNGLILAQGSFNGGTSQYVELIPTTPTTPAPSAGFLAAIGLLLVLVWWASQRFSPALRGVCGDRD